MYDGTPASARALGLTCPGEVAYLAFHSGRPPVQWDACADANAWTEAAHAVKRHVLANPEPATYTRRGLLAHVKALTRKHAHFGLDPWGPHQYTTRSVQQAVQATFERAACLCEEAGAISCAKALRAEARAVR